MSSGLISRSGSRGLAAIRGWEAGTTEYAGLEGVFMEAYMAVQAGHGGDDGEVSVADMT